MQLVHSLPTYVRFCAMMNEVQTKSMTATLNLTANTLEYIEELEQNNYSYEDMIDFIEEHGEEDFCKYYEDYVEIGEEHSYNAADAFIASFGINDIDSFSESYYGEYDSEECFAESYFEMMEQHIPEYVVVDWEGTWESNLRHDFVFEDGFVFNRNY